MPEPHLFFDLAKTGKRVSPVWWAVLVAIVATLVGQATGGTLYIVAYFVLLASSGDLNVGREPDEDAILEMIASFNSAEQGLFLISSFVFIACIIFLWTVIYERRSIVSMGFHSLSGGLFKFVRGGIFGLVSMAVAAYGMEALGYAAGSGITTPNSWLMVWPLGLLMLGWIVQGSSEEIVARGLLFQSVGARHGLIVALIVSSTMFTLAHSMNANLSLLFFVNLALYSLFACFYALREASLWGICGHHAMWNFAQGNLFGFAVSGEQFGADKLMQFTETGPDLITGGATGPEGGLVTTVILGVSMAVLLMIKPSKVLYDRRPAQPSTNADACSID